MDSNCVSNIGVTRESSQNNYNKDCESRDDIGGELDEITATMQQCMVFLQIMLWDKFN